MRYRRRDRTRRRHHLCKEVRWPRRPLSFESLEPRCVLAVATPLDAADHPADQMRLEVVPGEVVLSLPAGHSFDGLSSYLVDSPFSSFLPQGDSLVAQSMTSVARIGGLNIATIDIDPTIDVFAAAEALSTNDLVSWAAPNYRYVGPNPQDFVPDDPQFGNQYHHTASTMNNEAAWDVVPGGGAGPYFGDKEIVVAVTDDGVDIDHEDLYQNIWINQGEIPPGTSWTDVDGNGILTMDELNDIANAGVVVDTNGNSYIDGNDLIASWSNLADEDANGRPDDVIGWDFISNPDDNDPDPDGLGDHGTHVAGIAAAATNNAAGVAGTAGNVTIMPLRFYDYNTNPWTSTVILETFVYAVDNGADIISTSYNMDGWASDPTVMSAYQYIADNGLLHFNSAGNGSALNPPRQVFEQSLLVASTDNGDGKSSFSNYGDGIDIAAPGGSIYSTVNNDSYGFKSGTSMAAPNAAGAAALLWSHNPTWTNFQVASQLSYFAEDIDGPGTPNPTLEGLLGGGRVETFAAITGSMPAPQLLSIEGLPPSGTQANTSPVDFTLRFDQIMDPASVLDGANFELVERGPDDTFDTGDDVAHNLLLNDNYLVGSNDFVVDIDGALPFGEYRVRLVSGGLQNPFGAAFDGDGDGTGGDPYDHFFDIVDDFVGPRVISSSVLEGDTVSAGGTTNFTFGFDEDLDAAGLGPEDVTLVGATTGAYIPTAFNYSAATDTLDVAFGGLVEDVYTLTLLSGNGQFEDPVGNELDGEPDGGTTVPSGDGFPGGDFVVTFAADAVVSPYPTPLEAVLPLGSLIHDPPVSGTISTPSDTDSYTIDMDAGQTITVVVSPDATLDASITLFDPSAAPLATIDANGLEGEEVIQTIATTESGTYTVEISGAGGTAGGYTAELIVNAAAEVESHNGATNDTLATAQDIDGSFIDLGVEAAGTNQLTETPQLYWTDAGGVISRAETDGSNLVDVHSLSGQGAEFAVDPVSGTMFWTLAGEANVRRANLDGSNEEIVVSSSGAIVGEIDVDPLHAKLYVYFYVPGVGVAGISRFNLDGTNPETITTFPNDGFGAMSVDPIGEKIYWLTQKAGTGEILSIQRMNFNGSGVEELASGRRYADIEVDPIGQKVYWVTEDTGDRRIQRANLDGSNLEDILPDTLDYSQFPGYVHQPRSITVDAQAGRIYWVNDQSPDDRVMSANLDGSNIHQVLSGPSTGLREIDISDELPEPVDPIAARGAVVGALPAASDFFEDFATTTYEPSRWSSVQNATIDDVGIGEPSGPFAARLNGNPDGIDIIESAVLDLSGATSAELSYYFQQTGGGESPDSGDDLVLEYFDGSTWVELERQLGSGPDMTTFEQSTVTLPSAALHSNFQFRFVADVSAGSFDDWFVDDIDLQSDGSTADTEDWFSFTLDDGEVATLALTSLSSGAITLDLFDDLGDTLATGSGGAANLDSVISQFRDSTTDGAADTYYARLIGTGQYSLVITRGADFDTEPNDELAPLAQDITSSGAVLGHVAFGSPAISGETEPNDDGVAGGSAADLPFANDLSGNFTSAGGDDYQASVTGNISAGSDGDWDFFKILASPGDTLEIEMRGSPSGQGTLGDPYLRLFDNNGLQIAANDDFFGLESFISYSAFSYAGAYYIVGDSFGGNTGTYTIHAALTTTDLQGAGSDDFYRVAVNAGDTLTIETLTPNGGPNQPSNDFDPAVELLDPTGALVASDDNSGPDGRNALLSHAAAVDGDYTIRILGAGDTAGEYILNVSGYTGSSIFEVVSSSPADGESVLTAPAQYTIDLNRNVLLPSVDSADLSINGSPALSVIADDADTLTFNLPALTDGTHTVEISAGDLTSVSGEPLEAFTATFTVDATGPRVVGSSIQQGDTVGAVGLSITLMFDEELDAASLGAEDVLLVGGHSGSHSPDTFNYDGPSSTLTLSYNSLPDDDFTLTLTSGNGAFEDVLGNDLDGEPVAFPIPPNVSGDGIAGGNFVVSFTADVTTSPYPTPLAAKSPLGSLVYDPPVAGTIGTAGDVDEYTIELDAGQTLSALVHPEFGLDVAVEIEGPTGPPPATADASGAGAAELLQDFGETGLAAGTYTVRVVGQSGTGAYTLHVALNAELEEEEHGGPANDTPVTAQDINDAPLRAGLGSFIPVGSSGAQRGAVLGSTADGFDVTLYKANVQVADLTTAESVIANPSFQTAVVSDTAGTINYLNSGPAGHYTGDLPFPGAVSPTDDFVLEATGTVFIPQAGAWTFGVNSDDGFGLELTNGVDTFNMSFPTTRAPNDTLSTFNITTPGQYDVRLVSFDRFGGAEVELFAAPGTFSSFDAGAFDLVGDTAGGGLEAISSDDYYSFQLADGQSATLALSGHSGSGAQLQLYDSDGTTLLASGLPPGNADQVINNFVDQTTEGFDSTYYVRVAGGNLDYTLLVTKDADFDREANDDLNGAQHLQGVGGVLGGLSGGAPGSGGSPLVESGGGDDADGGGPKVVLDENHEYVPNRLIVRFADGFELADHESLVAAQGGDLVRQFTTVFSGGIVELTDPGGEMATALESWNSLEWIEYAEPDYIQHITQTFPNDPSFGQLYGLHNTGQTGGTSGADIDAPEAWDIFTGDGSVIIAGIDTGIDYNHEDLAANMWVNPGEIPGNGVDDDGNGWIDDVHGIDSINNDGDPMDDNSHGSHTAGTFGAVGDNGIGVVGVNWNVQIMALKFLGAGGSGSSSDAITLLDYMTDMKVNRGQNVVASNNSWGGGGFLQSLQDAIEASNNAGILFVAAAGNHGGNNDSSPFYPATYPLDGIISVAGTDHNDNDYTSSGYGPTTVDVAAPAVSVYSTNPGNNYGNKTGTSMATPHVAGAVAFLSAISPSSSPMEIKDAILASVDPLPDFQPGGVRPILSGGRLNLPKALEELGDPGDYYTIEVNSGDALDFETFTPAGGTLQFVNDLDPALELYDETGTLVASDSGTADGRNALLSHVAGSTGAYTIRVFGESSPGGEYFLQISGATGGNPAPEVTSSTPADGEILNAFPASITLDFSESLLLTSIEAADLTVNGLAALSATVIDADTLQFQIDPLADAGDGVYNVEVLAGNLTDLQGIGGAAYNGTFTVDSTGPTIIATQWNGGAFPVDGVLPEGELSFTATFDEDLLGPVAGDVMLVDNITGSAYLPDSATYDPVADTFTADFPFLPEGEYTLTLLSGIGAVEDLVGNDLDGEPLGPGADGVPTGDGSPGGDYVIDFTLDAIQPRSAEEFVRLEPLGSLVFGSYGNAGLVNSAADTDEYEFHVQSGETVSLHLTPDDPTATVDLLFDGVLYTAAGPGASLTTANLLPSGPGSLAVSVGANATTAFTLDIVKNAVLESYVAAGDTSDGNEMPIDGSFMPLGSGRFAVTGNSGVTTLSVEGIVWGVQPATGQILKIDPGSGAVLESFSAPGNLSPTHTQIGLAIAEGGASLLYVNSDDDASVLYRLDPDTGAVLSTESLAGNTIDGLGFDSIGGAFSQDFESGLLPNETLSGAFTINNTNGPLNNGTMMAGHPQNYGNNEYSYYEVALDLTGATGTVTLQFDYAAHIENHFDRVNVQASVNPINPPLDLITPTVGLLYEDQGNIFHQNLGQIAFDSNGALDFGTAEFDLTQYAGQIVNVRLQFGTDGSVTNPGINIDNIVVNGLAPAAQYIFLSDEDNSVRRQDGFSGAETPDWATGQPTGALGGDDAGRQFGYFSDGFIHEFDPFADTDAFLGTLDAPAAGIEGLAYDGTNLYAYSTSTNLLYRLDPDAGAQGALVALLALDETSGTSAPDTSPFGVDNSGTLQNGPQWVPGVFGNAVQFDGIDDYISLSDSDDINLGTHAERTISLWFQVDDASINSRKQVLYEEGGNTRGLNIYVYDGSLYVGGWNDDANQSGWGGTWLATSQIQSGQWHQVTLMLDGTGSVEPGALRAYLDGELFGSGDGSQLWGHTSDIGIGAISDLTLFHDGTTPNSGHGLAGKIDNVEIYNRVAPPPLNVAGGALFGLAANDLSSITLNDIDEYTLDLTGKAGQPIDVILAGQDGADFSGELLELLDIDGNTVLAAASPDPLGTVADNYDLGILDFLVPADGVYTLRLTSTVAGDYGLIVTDPLTFDSEPNDATTDPLRSLNDTGAALGHLGASASLFVEPDDYADGTVLDTVVPGITLSNQVNQGSVYSAFASFGAPTGTQVFAPAPGSPSGWSDGSNELRADFESSVNAVSIDAGSDDASDVSFLRAYDAGGNLLQEVLSGSISSGGSETLTITRSSADIAYIIAAGLGGDISPLDNLRTGNEVATPFTGDAQSSGETTAGAEGLKEESHQDHDHFLPDFYLPPTEHLVDAGGFLTGAADGDRLDIGLNYLVDQSDVFSLTTDDVAGLTVTDQYTDPRTGITHVYLQQTHAGLPVANAVANLNVTEKGEIINVGSSLIAGLGVDAAIESSPAISAADALVSLADYFDWTLTAAPEAIDGGDEFTTSIILDASGVSLEDVPADLHYVPVGDGQIELAWRLNVQTVDGQHWLDASVSALDGDVVYFVDWADAADYRVFPVPVEAPSFTNPVGTRSLETDPHLPASPASPFGWHDTDGSPGAEFTITQGNNVNVYADRNNDNQPDAGSQPDGGAGLVFDFPVDFAQAPLTYQAAAVSNLFYWNNILHDIHYQYGFDEVSGNFQVNNYGNGGLGGDAVNAEAQDGADVGNRNNANMFTPPDGSVPRMQMYLWDTATPELDGDFDNGIIIHEYGHGVSNRLTGGPGNSGALNTIQSGGMGEGWSDWWGLILTQEDPGSGGPGPLDGRGIGTYALNESVTGPGIRTQRYSFDTSVNNHTLDDIIGSSSVHFVGETWATALWDLNWLLIEGSNLDGQLDPPAGKPPFANHPGLPAPLGFNPDFYDSTGTEGNIVAMNLVMEGLKLQPANPTLLEARDAILAADQALYGGAHQLAIWTAFARRGMGHSATSGPSSGTSVVEAFDLPAVSQGTVALDQTAYEVGDTVSIEVRDLDLTGLGPIAVDVVSSGGDVEQVSLTEVDLGIFTGSIDTGSSGGSSGDGTLQVSVGDLVTVTYNDADDGTGNPAVVDDTADIIFLVPSGGDLYSITLAADEGLQLRTSTPLDDPAGNPPNELDPRLIVYDPGGNLIVMDDNSADGKNAELVFTAGSAGDYLIHVVAESGTGEYLLEASTPTGAPTVTGIQLNAGYVDPESAGPTTWSQQRSGIYNIEVTFSEDMGAIDVSDLTLANLGVDADGDTDQMMTLDSSQLNVVGNVLTISFDPTISGQDLPDGVYELVVKGSATSAGGVPLGTDHVHTGDATNKFYKLTGDWNGDTGVSLPDFLTLRYWFGESTEQGGGTAPQYVDLNHDMGISLADLLPFRANSAINAQVNFPTNPIDVTSPDDSSTTESSAAAGQQSDVPEESGAPIESAPEVEPPVAEAADAIVAADPPSENSEVEASGVPAVESEPPPTPETVTVQPVADESIAVVPVAAESVGAVQTAAPNPAPVAALSAPKSEPDEASNSAFPTFSTVAMVGVDLPPSGAADARPLFTGETATRKPSHAGDLPPEVRADARAEHFRALGRRETARFHELAATPKRTGGLFGEPGRTNQPSWIDEIGEDVEEDTVEAIAEDVVAAISINYNGRRDRP